MLAHSSLDRALDGGQPQPDPWRAPVPPRPPSIAVEPGDTRAIRRWTSGAVVRSCVVSALVHTALVIGLALAVDAIENLDEPGELIATLDMPNELVSRFPEELHPVSADVVAQGGSRGGGPWAVARRGGSGPGPVIELADAISGGGDGHVGFRAASAEELNEAPPRTSGGTTFFGVNASGRDFVFVVDMSGSMREERRFTRALNELRRTILALYPGQRYYVIFFNHESYPMPGGELIDADEKSYKATLAWFKGVQPIGGTYPLSSLLTALELKPNAIFLLSDGQFDPSTVQAVSDANGSSDRVPIHTIAFASRAGEAVLQALSRASGGTFRFVR